MLEITVYKFNVCFICGEAENLERFLHEYFCHRCVAKFGRNKITEMASLERDSFFVEKEFKDDDFVFCYFCGRQITGLATKACLTWGESPCFCGNCLREYRGKYECLKFYLIKEIQKE